ncbi:hypothetical protein B0H65DRAFT_278451 [Neurospora tetraspora]|uniref:Secreted protein n=1 Tax=Neurospora tetraspora TaxID=94610 RepID=A0AAE0JCW3_9PEZI|nr:hypothetical protein B0H65DRAFT_278451 [Neurospora tetraspora]
MHCTRPPIFHSMLIRLSFFLFLPSCTTSQHRNSSISQPAFQISNHLACYLAFNTRRKKNRKGTKTSTKSKIQCCYCIYPTDRESDSILSLVFLPPPPHLSSSEQIPLLYLCPSRRMQ